MKLLRCLKLEMWNVIWEKWRESTQFLSDLWSVKHEMLCEMWIIFFKKCAPALFIPAIWIAIFSCLNIVRCAHRAQCITLLSVIIMTRVWKLNGFTHELNLFIMFLLGLVSSSIKLAEHTATIDANSMNLFIISGSHWHANVTERLLPTEVFDIQNTDPWLTFSLVSKLIQVAWLSRQLRIDWVQYRREQA